MENGLALKPTTRTFERLFAKSILEFLEPTNDGQATSATMVSEARMPKIFQYAIKGAKFDANYRNARNYKSVYRNSFLFAQVVTHK